MKLVGSPKRKTSAAISLIEARADIDWAHQMVAAGQARWNGGKPAGGKRPRRAIGQKASTIVIEDRR